MKTLVLVSPTGGVGKSCVATLMSHYFAHQKLRVLAIDLDHRADFSRAVQRSNRAGCPPFDPIELLTPHCVRVPDGPFVLIGASDSLSDLERTPDVREAFSTGLRDFVRCVDARFDVCVIDTPCNPDIRLFAALACADVAVVVVRLTRELVDGVGAVLDDDEVGIRRQHMLDRPSRRIGLLPCMTQRSAFQRDNLARLSRRHRALLIGDVTRAGTIANIPRRSAVARAQKTGAVLWEMPGSSARDAWKAIAPATVSVAAFVLSGGQP